MATTVTISVLTLSMKIAYTGCPRKSGTADFKYFASKMCHTFLHSLNKTFSAEENDTRIIEFGWVILILCPFLETLSFSNFAWFWRRMSVELYRDRPSIMVFLRKTIDPCQQKIQRISGNGHFYESHSLPNLRSSVAKNLAKFENDCVLRNGHRIKILYLDLGIILFCGRCFI